MKQIVIILVIVCVLCVFEILREVHTFRVTHYHIKSDKLKGLRRERKVILLSDLHNCNYGNKNEKLLRAIREEKPDYILVAGDMLVGKAGASPNVAADFMTKLPEICEVFHSNGNHEQRMKDEPEVYGDVFQKYIKMLTDAGVHCLSNEKREWNWDGVRVCLYGLELSHRKYGNFKKPVMKQDRMANSLGTADREIYNILIAHNPVFMDNYVDWGADLVVSGHVHGGMARIPGIGGVISPQFILFPKYSGEMKKIRDTVAVVSKGLGMHTIKIRFMNPAEIVVLHIDSTED